VDNIISALKCASIILDQSLDILPCQMTGARKDGNLPGRILLHVTSDQRSGAKTLGLKGDRPGETSNPPSGLRRRKMA